LKGTHEEEIGKLRTGYEAEKTKASDSMAKLRADHDMEKLRAIEDAKTKLRAEHMTEKSKTLGSSRITLDFHTQSTVAKEVVSKLIEAGAVPAGSLEICIPVFIVLT
jgi:hypothetical protein